MNYSELESPNKREHIINYNNMYIVYCILYVYERSRFESIVNRKLI